MATAVAPPTTAKTTTSVDPLYVQAVAQAKAALDAQQAPVQNEQAASDAYYKQRGTDATDNAAALSGLLKGIAPATQGIYQNAEQNQELAASGFSQGMQDALKGNADNLNSMLDKLGSPATIDSKAKETGDVLYGLGGYMPGETFNREGAAFAAAAAKLPADALLRGSENAKQQGLTGDAAHAKFDATLQEMAGKLPGDIQTNYSQLQSLSLANKRFALAVQNQRFTQAYKIAESKLRVSEFNARQGLEVAKYNTGISEFNARQSLAITKAQWQQANADRTYGLNYSKFKLAEKKAAGIQARGGLTQAAYEALYGKAYDFAKGLYEGVPNKVLYPGVKDTADSWQKRGGRIGSDGSLLPTAITWKQQHLTYQKAIVTLVNKYPALGVTAAVEAANQYFKPGEGGRPQTPGVIEMYKQGGATMTGLSPNFVGNMGDVHIAPGANRAGAALNPSVVNFVRQVAGVYGNALTIGTGTAHNEYVLGSNRVSDHWGGNAADIPASGADLTRLGQAALIAAGQDPAWARRQTGGLFNIPTPGGRIQIIFNSHEGGNHFNHLHVGLGG